MSARTQHLARTSPVPDVPTSDLEQMLDTDDAEVDTAVIPRLATPSPTATPTPTPAAVSPAVATPTTTRHRHASATSLAAVRRNQVALLVLVLAIVLLGSLAGLAAGWLGVAAYALAVGGLLVARTVANRRYAPRHCRYAPRHG